MFYREFKVLVGYGRSAYNYEYIFNNMQTAATFYKSLGTKKNPMPCTFKKKFLGLNDVVIAREGYDIKEPFNAL